MLFNKILHEGEVNVLLFFIVIDKDEMPHV
jgi:hypothetical protein